MSNYHPKKEKELKENQDQDRKKNVKKKQRKVSSIGKSAKKNPAQKNISRLSQVKISDLAFVLALIAAALKDILDVFEATGFGYILVIILTFLIFIFIGFMVLLGVMAGGGGGLEIIFPLFGGVPIEMLFGLNILPITMLVVIRIYFIVLKKRKKNTEKIRQKQLAI